MKFSRRRFIATAASAAGALLVLESSGLGQIPEPPLPPIGDGGALSKMNFRTFFEQMNTEFLFLNKDRVEVPLKLVKVEDQRPLAKQRWGQGRENFMLRFSGHWRYPLPQNTYEVSHFALGKFDLFITSAGVIDGELFFTAIINRVEGF